MASGSCGGGFDGCVGATLGWGGLVGLGKYLFFFTYHFCSFIFLQFCKFSLFANVKIISSCDSEAHVCKCIAFHGQPGRRVHRRLQCDSEEKASSVRWSQT